MGQENKMSVPLSEGHIDFYFMCQSWLVDLASVIACRRSFMVHFEVAVIGGPLGMGWLRSAYQEQAGKRDMVQEGFAAASIISLLLQLNVDPQALAPALQCAPATSSSLVLIVCWVVAGSQ